MAYYDALIAKWAQAPAGTTQSKIDWINAETITGNAIPMLIQTNDLYNKINRAEHAALSPANQTSIHDIIMLQGLCDFSPGTEMRKHTVSLFPASTAPITNANLLAWCGTFDKPQIPWWQGTLEQGGGGLSGPVSQADCDAAGLV